MIESGAFSFNLCFKYFSSVVDQLPVIYASFLISRTTSNFCPSVFAPFLYLLFLLFVVFFFFRIFFLSFFLY
eukprot:UN06155